MKSIMLILLLVLSGCASHQFDKFGNYNNVTLTAVESRHIAADISQFIQQTRGARTIVNFNSDRSLFATTLSNTLRRNGIGVTQAQQVYPNLHYRVEALNAHQFVVTVQIDRRHFSRIWSLIDDVLVPLPTRTQFGG
ncbi:hypothetical protein [Photobacterium leiognathi]|uniref:hypothetical protein n=1 Tax=Photobacterium leiognathi TaxID=553611 RepID=UPI002981D019|nr:hypothetical protein [Photobacterium leiognathi]